MSEPRKAATYRPSRRNQMRADRSVWRGVKAKALPPKPILPNKCHKTPEERARPPEPAMNFVGSIVGLSLAFRAVPKIVQLPRARQPKPPKEFFVMPPEALHKARLRHPWWRRKFEREAKSA